MSRQLRWGVPAAVAALGAAVAVGGLAYDLTYAGLPYQDPTPEMEDRWRFHSRRASAVQLSGLALLSVGLTGLGAVAVGRRA